MSDTVHIASLLVQGTPENRDEIETGILKLGGTELAHSGADGRLIVTLETANEAEIVQTLTEIQLLTGVVSASLVYHQTDCGAESAAAGV